MLYKTAYKWRPEMARKIDTQKWRSEYPDRTFEKRAREDGHNCPCLWQERGPKNTGIAWMVAYRLGSGVVIVQTYTEGGWRAYTDGPEAEFENIVQDVYARCGVAEHPHAE